MFNRSMCAAIAAGLSVACVSAVAAAGEQPAPAAADALQVFPNVTVVNAVSPAADQGTTLGVSGFRAFKDKDTGRLRNPTVEEMTEEAAAGPAVATPSTVETRTLPSGIVSARLDESFSAYSVATKSADGQVRTDCAADEHAAREIVSTQPREENNNDR